MTHFFRYLRGIIESIECVHVKKTTHKGERSFVIVLAIYLAIFLFLSNKRIIIAADEKIAKLANVTSTAPKQPFFLPDSSGLSGSTGSA